VSYLNEWTRVPCHNCAGHGLLPDYGCGEDFYGEKECRDCNGTGNLFRSPKGALAKYPGGPFVGREGKLEAVS
jgi:DnaJ-class molecular chaperone